MRRSDGKCAEDIADAVLGQLPGPTADAGPDKEICFGDDIEVAASATSGTAPLEYAWTGPGFAANTQTIIITDAGTYTVVVTDANNCTSSDEMILTVPEINPGEIGIPNVSCPEGNPDEILSVTLALSLIHI